MSRIKTRGANLPVPQNKDEAAEAVKRIGVTSRQIARMEADLNDQIAEMKKQAEEAAAPLRDRKDELTEGLKLWAEANREKLTDGGRVKSADLGTGKISWRFRPPSVRLSKVDAILEALKTLGLHRFIRVKEEPNKEAMLAEPEIARTVSGVSIGTEGEDFIVEPFEVELAAGKAVA
ncbi:MAG: host-nuclease inhibitor Gam family protein [Rhabdaerophilum sp.]